MQQISAHICDRGGGFVEANSFLAKKKTCFAVSLIGSTCVCFCRMTELPVFYLTHFDWLPDHFRKFSDAQLKNSHVAPFLCIFLREKN